MGWLARIWPGRFENPSPSATEAYVLAWLGIEIAITAALLAFYDYVAAIGWLIYIFGALHGLEIILRTIAVDITNVISAVRTLTLAAINYVQLMLWFGLVYALNYQLLHGASQPATAFYFSIITQLTIGYGDVYPEGWLRIIAGAQGLIAALFVIVVLGRAVSAPRADPR
jgi:Ion channel